MFMESLEVKEESIMVMVFEGHAGSMRVQWVMVESMDFMKVL